MRIIAKNEVDAAAREMTLIAIATADGSLQAGLTFAAGELKICKAGGSYANVAGTVTDLANGEYRYVPTAGEVDTAGPLKLKPIKTGTQPYLYEAQVLDLSTDASVAAEVVSQAFPGSPVAGSVGERLSRIPNATAGANGGLSIVVSGATPASLASGERNAVADATLDRAISEPTGVFTWPGSLRAIIQWIGAVTRNKINETGSTQAVRNAADNANIATATVSDDNTTTVRGPFA